MQIDTVVGGRCDVSEVFATLRVLDAVKHARLFFSRREKTTAETPTPDEDAPEQSGLSNSLSPPLRARARVASREARASAKCPVFLPLFFLRVGA